MPKKSVNHFEVFLTYDGSVNISEIVTLQLYKERAIGNKTVFLEESSTTVLFLESIPTIIQKLFI